MARAVAAMSTRALAGSKHLDVTAERKCGHRPVTRKPSDADPTVFAGWRQPVRVVSSAGLNRRAA